VPIGGRGRDAGGSRTRFNRFAVGRLTVRPRRHGALCPRQESNLVLDLRRVACESLTLRGRDRHTPPGGRTRPCGFEGRRATGTLAGMPSPGVEPGLRPSEGRVRFRHTPRAIGGNQQGRQVLNPVREAWRLAALPGARPCDGPRPPSAGARGSGHGRCRPGGQEAGQPSTPTPGAAWRGRQSGRAGRLRWCNRNLRGDREKEGARRELNPAPRDPQARVLPLHHGHHRGRPCATRAAAEGAGVEPARP